MYILYIIYIMEALKQVQFSLIQVSISTSKMVESKRSMKTIRIANTQSGAVTCL